MTFAKTGIRCFVIARRMSMASWAILPVWLFAQTASAELLDCANMSAESTAKLIEERPEILNSNGVVIGSILVEPGSIFDLNDPKEDGFLYRLANKAHIETRPNVIQQQLLFAEGDAFSKQLLDESERLLRGNRYLKDATVEPILTDNCVVDVSVHTIDTWTLAPKMTFSRSGGKNKSKVGLKEMNLLGTGIYIEALYSTDVDRDSNQLKVTDRNLGDSWYSLEFLFEKSSDGRTNAIDFGKPFYALDATDTHGFSYYDNNRIDSYYDLGKIVGDYRHQTKAYEIYGGWSTGLVDEWVRRVTFGLAYDHQEFAPAAPDGQISTALPMDRQLFYPFVGIEWLQNKFDKSKNQDQIGRTEDRFLGTRIAARLGRSRTLLGSDRDAWLLDIAAQTSLGDGKKTTWILDGELASRIESGGLRDFGLQGSVRYYRRQSEKRLFFATAGAFYGYKLDADHVLDLGGDTGLRGYPLRYQSGDKRALFSVEQRFFTDWYPFRLFHVGAAVFFDVGRTWGDSGIETTDLGWLKDAGVGLRLGNTRSGLGNVIHIDLAFPIDRSDSIDSVQFLVSTKRSF